MESLAKPARNSPWFSLAPSVSLLAARFCKNMPIGAVPSLWFLKFHHLNLIINKLSNGMGL